jgi:glycosyltransferase involved in cell wall biosynthesis
VRDRLDGLLFPPGDEQALAQCMVELAESQELRSRMAANCRSRFLEKFELSRSVAAQADWINHLIGHGI